MTEQQRARVEAMLDHGHYERDAEQAEYELTAADEALRELANRWDIYGGPEGPGFAKELRAIVMPAPEKP